MEQIRKPNQLLPPLIKSDFRRKNQLIRFKYLRYFIGDPTCRWFGAMCDPTFCDDRL